MPKTISYLKTQNLFKGFENEELEKILPLMETKKFAKDEHVFRVKTPCKGIYMVLSGRVEISKTTTDGWRQPLVLLERDCFIGEIALLEKSNHATDARVIEPAELLFLPKKAFEDLEKKEPVLMLKMLKNIVIVAGQNVRRMNEKFLKALVNY